VALAAAAGLIAPAASAGVSPKCHVPPALVRFAAPLPALSAALADRKPVRIVALGSSSTAGAGASGPRATYPARLQAELSERLPGIKVSVDNLGVGGQLASDMLPRIGKEVLPRRPTLVIWQTGVNDAVRHVDIDAFGRTVGRGIEQLRRSGVDVVLLDMQYFPGSRGVRGFARYLDVMHGAAAARNVPIMRRFAIMEHLVKSAQFRPDQLLAPDLFHSSDLTYACLGDFIAEAMLADAAPAMHAKGPPAPVKEAGALSKVSLP
jgi:lysophospholipase L1-like esterase